MSTISYRSDIYISIVYDISVHPQYIICIYTLVTYSRYLPMGRPQERVPAPFAYPPPLWQQQLSAAASSSCCCCRCVEPPATGGAADAATTKAGSKTTICSSRRSTSSLIAAVGRPLERLGRRDASLRKQQFNQESNRQRRVYRCPYFAL